MPLSFQNDSDNQRGRKPPSDVSSSDQRAGKSGRRVRKAGNGVGDALRSAYQRTLQEEIPPEMLDLLGKLG